MLFVSQVYLPSTKTSKHSHITSNKFVKEYVIMIFDDSICCFFI